jgi:hypothetical protein
MPANSSNSFWIFDAFPISLRFFRLPLSLTPLAHALMQWRQFKGVADQTSDGRLRVQRNVTSPASEEAVRWKHQINFQEGDKMQALGYVSQRHNGHGLTSLLITATV